MKKNIGELIDSLNVNDATKDEFNALNFMYYQNYINGTIKSPLLWQLSPEYLSLSDMDKRKIGVGGSILGFFFGFFAYFFKGMFVKGLIRALPLLIFFIIPTEGIVWEVISRVVGLSYSIFCALMLKKDYFCHKCLQNKVVNTYIKANQVDFNSNEEIQKMIATRKPKMKFRWCLLIVMACFTLGVIGVVAALTIPTLMSANSSSRGSAYLGSFNEAISYCKSDPVEGIVRLDKLIKTHPDDYILYSHKADCYKGLDIQDKVVENTLKAIEILDINPNSQLLQDQRARYNIDEKTTTKSIRKEKVGLLKKLGVANSSLKNYSEATKNFTDAISINDNTPSYFWRGTTRYYQNDKQGALSDFNVYKSRVESSLNEGKTTYTQQDLQSVNNWIKAIN